MKTFFNQLKRYWLPWLLLTFFLILFGFLAVDEFKHWFGLKKEISRREAEVEELQARTAKISAELERAADPSRLEKEARAKLNLKREGEEVFVVVGLESITAPENFEEVFAADSVKNQNTLWLNIKSWWEYFF